MAVLELYTTQLYMALKLKTKSIRLSVMTHVWMPQNGCFHRHRSRFDLPVVPSDNIRSSLLDICL